MQTEGRAALTSTKLLRTRQIFIAITTSLFAIDLASKNWADSYLKGREPIKVIGDFLQLRYSTNPGAAFSFFTDATLLLSFLKLAVAAFIIFYIREVTNIWWAASLAALLGGVLGNLYDRIARPPGLWRGEVVDWIELPNWPIFNVADSSIVVAGIAMTILAMRNIQPKERDGIA